MAGGLLAGCDPNYKPTYGEQGDPKNCRAIIAANLDDWHNGVWTAEEILHSIERNCGMNGYSWGWGIDLLPSQEHPLEQALQTTIRQGQSAPNRKDCGE